MRKLICCLLFLFALTPFPRTAAADDYNGFYLAAGPLGMFAANNPGWDLDAGIGLQALLGYDWTYVGVRGSFTYAALDHGPAGPFCAGICNPGIPSGSADFIGGSVDFTVQPLGGINFPLQPYALIGVGAQADGLVLDRDTHIHGNLGLGLRMFLGHHFSIGLEGDYKPVLYYTDDCGGLSDCTGDNAKVLNLFSASLMAGVHF